MKKKHITIGFVGHSYSRGNFGLCALAFGEQSVIEKACEQEGVDYDIICFETGIINPCNNHHKVYLEQFDLRKVFKTARQFSKCDLILDITGGDSFSDIYGVKLFIVNFLIKVSVMLSSTPYICAPQTYGPFERKWIKIISNLYLSKARGIFGRDERSGPALNRRNSKKIKCVADLGFALPYDQAEKRAKFTVGFNVNGLLYQSNNILGPNSNYKQLCHDIIPFLLGKGCEVVLVPHVVDENKTIDNDYYVCLDLANEYGLEIPPFFQSPTEAKTYISRCHFFIGSRMHATIGAVSSCVPTLPLAYSRKFEGVYNTIGYQYTLDLKAQSNEHILNVLESMLDKDYNKVKNDVEQSIINVKSKTAIYINDISAQPINPVGRVYGC